MIYVKELELTNFRCYEDKLCQFKPEINVIVGDNAVGKTSLVEAIGIIGMTKSHKASSDLEIITLGKDYFHIKAYVENEGVVNKYCVYCNKMGKRISKNDFYYKSMTSYIGEVKVVFFHPDDLKIISGEPRIRRKFLDMSIGQMDKTYLHYLSVYNKVLKERNELLKTYNGEEESLILLDIYTNELIKAGSILIEKRNEFINKINKFYTSLVQTISDNNECGLIVYNYNVFVDNFEKTINSRKKYDIINKTTSCGPHRDDFSVYFNKLEASRFGSQGQQKTLALCLKLALIDLLKDDNLIVVLDDVFGELDKKRQNDLFKLFNSNMQIFITTTSIDSLEEKIIEKSNIIKIDKVGE